MKKVCEDEKIKELAEFGEVGVLPMEIHELGVGIEGANEIDVGADAIVGEDGTVGTNVGTIVGLKLGLYVGTNVGVRVGVLVGFGLGALEGSGEGKKVGAEETGLELGEGVAEDVSTLALPPLGTGGLGLGY